jgi:hypothetical protein
MAIDSREKRAGAILGMPWMVITPIADGTIDGADRQMVADVYPGVTPGLPPTAPSNPLAGEDMYGMMRMIRFVRTLLTPYGSMYIDR